MLLSSGCGNASAFAGMRRYLEILPICDFTTFATGLVKQGEFSARQLKASMSNVDFVHRLMLWTKTLYNDLFSALVVNMLPMNRGEAFLSFLPSWKRR